MNSKPVIATMPDPISKRTHKIPNQTIIKQVVKDYIKNDSLYEVKLHLKVTNKLLSGSHKEIYYPLNHTLML